MRPGTPGRLASGRLVLVGCLVLGRLLPDLAPARDHPAFRRLLAGGLLSTLGGSMTSFAVVLQLWDLTRSSLAVGLLGLTFVPVLVIGLLGGAVADTVDRRKLALTVSGCLMAVSAAFAAQAYAGLGQVWPLYALAMVQAVLQATAAPSRRTFMYATARLPAMRPADRDASGPLAAPLAAAAAPAWARPRRDCGSSAAGRCWSPRSSPTSTPCCSACRRRCSRR